MNPKPSRSLSVFLTVTILVGGAAGWAWHQLGPGPSTRLKAGSSAPARKSKAPAAAEANQDVEQRALSTAVASLGLTADQMQEMIRKGAQDKYAEGLALLQNRGNREALRNAFNAFQDAADAGNLDALVKVAEMLEKGTGTKQDLARAYEAYLAAAEAGNVRAQLKVAQMLERGTGTNADYELSAHWYETAAKDGDPAGWLGLGGLYANGRGFPQDYRKAFELYRRAASAGDANGLAAMGLATINGWGVDSSKDEGVALLKDAAGRGSGSAALSLARFAASGQIDGQPDPITALQWLKQASDAGDVESQRMLGRNLATGSWGEKDIAGAIDAFLHAADNGDNQALVDLAKVAIKMEPNSNGFKAALQYAQESALNGSAAGILLLAQLSTVAPPPEAAARRIETLVSQAAEGGDWRSSYIVALTAAGIPFRDAVIKASGAQQSDYLNEKLTSKIPPEPQASAPEALSMARPVLPEGLKFTGTVNVSFTINAGGIPNGVLVRGAGNPAVAEAVQTAVKSWRFKPATNGGNPSSSRITIPIKF